MLTLSNLEVKFNKTVLIKQFSLSVQQGQFVALKGPNGCGKTSLLKILAGQSLPSAGLVLWRGRKVSAKQLKKLVAVVSQIHAVADLNQKVEQFLLLARKRSLSFWQRFKSADGAIVANVLAEVGLSAFCNRFIKELSGGQLQRLMLAKALVQNTPIVVMDEPLNHIDQPDRIQLCRVLKKHLKNKVTVAVFHDEEMILRLSDQLVVLGDGDYHVFDKEQLSGMLHIEKLPVLE